MRKRYLCIIIAACCLMTMVCGCGQLAGDSKDKPTSTLQANGSTQDQESVAAEKLQEFNKKIEGLSTPYEKAKMALDIINVPRSYIPLDTSMNIFKDFLATEQAFTMAVSDYGKLSDKINVFEINGMRVVAYNYVSESGGESAAPSYAYLQQKVDGKIHVAVLYSDATKRVEHVSQPDKEKNLIVLTGTQHEVRPWRAFIDGFYIENGDAKNTEVLQDYKDDVWGVNPKDGTVFLTASGMAETYINKAPGEVIEVEAGNAKLTLKYDKAAMKYVAAK